MQVFFHDQRGVTELACDQAPSEVGKKIGERSEWESERRDSASDASGPLTARSARHRLHSATLGYLALNPTGSLFAGYNRAYFLSNSCLKPDD